MNEMIVYKGVCCNSQYFNNWGLAQSSQVQENIFSNIEKSWSAPVDVDYRLSVDIWSVGNFVEIFLITIPRF